MKNKKTRRFKIRYIVFGLLGVMALAALVFMRFGGFGTGENVNPEEFLAYAEPVENITVPESAKAFAKKCAQKGVAFYFVTSKSSADYESASDIKDKIIYNSTLENAYAKILLSGK